MVVDNHALLEAGSRICRQTRIENHQPQLPGDPLQLPGFLRDAAAFRFGQLPLPLENGLDIWPPRLPDIWCHRSGKVRFVARKSGMWLGPRQGLPARFRSATDSTRRVMRVRSPTGAVAIRYGCGCVS